MTEFRKVVVENESTSRNSLYMGIFVVAVVAIIAVAMIMWQPWAASQTTPGTNTTIIREQPAPSNDRTIIVPSVQAPPASTKTEINIETPPPTTNEQKTEETTSGETGSTGTTGSETTGN